MLMLLSLQDGGIVNIKSDVDSTSGCETCDYGSSYVNEFVIELTQKTIRIEVDQMYQHALSEGYMMQLLLPNAERIQAMTENEFAEWMAEKVEAAVEEQDAIVCVYEV